MYRDTDVVGLRPSSSIRVPDGDKLRADLFAYLAGFVSPERVQHQQQVLALRSRWVTLVLEDVYQPHNASAVLRTCDCFGVQDVHIVDERNDYTVHRAIALGAARWLDLYRHGGSDSAAAVEGCCATLKRRGYRLLATTPDISATNIDDVDIGAGPVAVLFGTELEGLTPTAMASVDETVYIPMVGFNDSLNVSVSAALVLRQLTGAMRACHDIDWRLSATEHDELQLDWLRRSLRHSEALVRHFLKERGLPSDTDSGDPRIVPDVDDDNADNQDKE